MEAAGFSFPPSTKDRVPKEAAIVETTRNLDRNNFFSLRENGSRELLADLGPPGTVVAGRTDAEHLGEQERPVVFPNRTCDDRNGRPKLPL